MFPSTSTFMKWNQLSSDTSISINQPEVLLSESLSMERNSPLSLPSVTSNTPDDRLNSTSSSSLPHNICPEICLICKEVATGYHYEVAACNGCKVFYRRAVVGQKVFKCSDNGDCYEDPNTRRKRACRACRFEKCIETGMNPLGMNMPYPERNSVLQYIIKRRQTAQIQPSTSREPELKNTLCRPLYAYEDGVNSIINDLLYLDLRTEMLRKSVYNPIPQEEPGLEAVLCRPNVLSSAKILKPMPNWPLKQEYMKFSNAIYGLFRRKDQERIDAMKASSRKFWMFFDALTAVEYAKTFPYLNKLEKNDQLIVIKKTIMLCSNLTQAYYSYANKSDSILLPDGTMPPFVSEKIRIGNVNIFDLFQKLTFALIRVGIDHKEYILLKALSLCNPALPGLSENGQQILTEERNKYSRALLSYCLATKGNSQGSARYANVLGITNTMLSQQQMQRNVYMLFNLITMKGINIPLITDIMDS